MIILHDFDLNFNRNNRNQIVNVNFLIANKSDHWVKVII